MRGMNEKFRLGPRTVTNPVPQPRSKEEEERAALLERRRQTRREILQSCLYSSALRFVGVGLVGGTIAARGFQVENERKKFEERAERSRLGESLREFVENFHSGELLLPVDEGTSTEILWCDKPQKVVICLTDIEVTSLPQIADALAEKGVALRHVLRTDKDAQSKFLYQSGKSIWVENLSAAKFRLSCERGEEFEHYNDSSEHRRHLLQAIASYDSVTSENPHRAQNVVVILRNNETEQAVNDRCLIDDLWHSSSEGGLAYVVIKIGKKASGALPSGQEEFVPKLVTAE